MHWGGGGGGGGGYANVYCRWYVPVHGLRGGSSTCGRGGGGGGKKWERRGTPGHFYGGQGGGEWSRRRGGGRGTGGAMRCPLVSTPKASVHRRSPRAAAHSTACARSTPPTPRASGAASGGCSGVRARPLGPREQLSPVGGGGGWAVPRVRQASNGAPAPRGAGGGGLGDGAPSPTLMGRAPKGCMASVPKNLTL